MRVRRCRHPKNWGGQPVSGRPADLSPGPFRAGGGLPGGSSGGPGPGAPGAGRTGRSPPHPTRGRRSGRAAPLAAPPEPPLPALPGGRGPGGPDSALWQPVAGAPPPPPFAPPTPPGPHRSGGGRLRCQSGTLSLPIDTRRPRGGRAPRSSARPAARRPAGWPRLRTTLLGRGGLPRPRPAGGRAGSAGASRRARGSPARRLRRSGGAEFRAAGGAGAGPGVSSGEGTRGVPSRRCGRGTAPTRRA